jgi:MFS family permease
VPLFPVNLHASPSPGRYAWIVVALLFPVALLNYLDRQMIAAMKTSVVGSISGITLDSQWGYMLGQFKWVYAFLSPVGGYVADRFSRRWTICGSLLAWSVVTWLTGRVTTYEGLLWTRTAMGLSEAFYIPAALALISDYHRGPTRSRATGIHQMGIYCGVIIGGLPAMLRMRLRSDGAGLSTSRGWPGSFTRSRSFCFFVIPRGRTTTDTPAKNRLPGVCANC